MNCHEVLRYTQPDQARTWKRMTLYRATDASDTMDMVLTEYLTAVPDEHVGCDAGHVLTVARPLTTDRLHAREG
ncbi:hypothetical protein [Streptomyces atratus]|uniref:hypothetical protein n=1 Tax=Streptomyces atratus TaxID=1893 RepID=UPI0022524658|nr:hypothetical protein [Streptomyces atratus]MCX5345945.1 hypothetical protein [Streptomyces atratus]